MHFVLLEFSLIVCHNKTEIKCNIYSKSDGSFKFINTANFSFRNIIPNGFLSSSMRQYEGIVLIYKYSLLHYRLLMKICIRLF